MSMVTCADLAQLIEPHPDRAAVLIVLRDVEGKPGGEIQFVTYGRTAQNKVEAHQLKEWIAREVFDGTKPPAVVHESFILDAAVNKEKLDRAVAILRRLADSYVGNGSVFEVTDEARRFLGVE